MCVRRFAPLAANADLATPALAPRLPGVIRAGAIAIEHTPADDRLGDPTGLGGVDCDGLIEAILGDGAAVFIIETTVVEPAFRACVSRQLGRAGRGQRACPDDVPVRADPVACAHQGVEGNADWRRAEQAAGVELSSRSGRRCGSEAGYRRCRRQSAEGCV